MGKHVQIQDGGWGPGRDLSENESLGKARKKAKWAGTKKGVRTNTSMSTALENPRYQPTSQNIARVHEIVDDRPKPVIMHGVITKIVGIGVHETEFWATPLDAELAKNGSIYGRSHNGRIVNVRGDKVLFDKFTKCAAPTKVGQPVVTWAVPNERGGYKAVRWTHRDLWTAATISSAPPVVRMLALAAALS